MKYQSIRMHPARGSGREIQTRFVAGVLGIFGVVLLAGCSAERDPSELLGPSQAGTVVVDAVLIVDQPLPPVFLSRTLDPGEPFSIEDARLSGATVNVSTGDQVFGLIEVETGIYVAGNQPPTVEPETVYRLEVILENGDRVTAETWTPPRLEDLDWVLLEDDNTTVSRSLKTFAELGEGVYEADENQLVHGQGLLQARFPRPDVAGFQVGIESLDPESDFVVDVSFLDDEDLDELERVVSSPALSGNDGELALPWGVVFFGGRYRVRVHAVDENWFDLIRSFPDLTGGGGGPFGGFGGNAGDNFETPLFHVDGGIGLFGSASVAAVGFFVLPQE